MDLRKLSSFIIGFGLVVMIPGILTVLSNLPLPPPPPPSARFSWEGFMGSALDPRKSATGVALINIDRDQARSGGFKTIAFGVMIVFAGVAMRMSAKPPAGTTEAAKSDASQPAHGVDSAQRSAARCTQNSRPPSWRTWLRRWKKQLVRKLSGLRRS